MRIHLDFETFSEVDIGVGTHAYAAHPTTTALMLGYAADSAPVKVWDCMLAPEMPHDLRNILLKADEIWAYNAEFERMIMLRCIGMEIPIEKWRCCQVYAYSLGFAGRMDDVLRRFEVGAVKDPEGKRLIQKFCRLQPKKRKVHRFYPWDEIIDWAKFLEYCKQDVETERMLWRKCARTGVQVNWSDYHLDQCINLRGLPIDARLVYQVLLALHIEQDRLMREMQGITLLENPNSVQQLLGWLNEEGAGLPNLKAQTVAKALRKDQLNDTLAPEVSLVLQLRQQLSKASVAKWAALEESVVEGRLRGAFQYVGAGRTGRFSGRKFQPHNLPRPTMDGEQAADVVLTGGYDLVSMVYDRPMDVFSSLLRSALTAPEGQRLVVADLSSIESVLAGWVCKCPTINRIFAEGRDVYKALASRLFEVDESEVTKAQRTIAKPAALGAQYGLGAKGLRIYADGMGVELDEVTAALHISVFRQWVPEIPGAWESLNAAIWEVMQQGGVAHACRCLFRRNGQFLECRLPSQRSIWYYQPRIESCLMPWKDFNGDPVYRDGLTYMGKNQFTQQWTRINTHGGKVLENVIQAVARDGLMEWLRRLEADGQDIVGHVHDEAIGVADQADAEGMLGRMINLIQWPAMPWGQDLQLRASGYVAKRYRKD